MQQDRSGWIVGIGFLLFILVMYLWSSYNSIFERRVSYIYHPGTDQIYRVEMAPSLNRYRPWEPFIPFHSLYYGNPDGGEYVGKLQSVVAEAEADRRLLEEDFDAWNAKQLKELEVLLKESKGRDLEFWDIDYFIRRDVTPKQLLPNSMSELKEYLDDEPSSLLAVDAVVSKWTVKGKRPEIKILEGALLIRGRAASKITRWGYNALLTMP